VRITVLGGTRFIGRAIVEELAGAGHEVVVVHRGVSEPDDLPDVEHVHVDRADLPSLDGDVLVDTYAMTATDAEAALAAVAPAMQLVVLSSQDVYAAHGELHAGGHGHAMPIDETAPVRTTPLPYAEDGYEKLDVEERYLARGGTVLRLPATYGEHDGQRREEFVLGRIRGGRTAMPFGAGTFLWTRAYVGDVAVAVRLAAEHGGIGGEVLNIGERRTWTIRRWAEGIIAAAGAELELVTVPPKRLPPDLVLTGALGQHLLTDSSKARSLLGWADRDPGEGVRRSVAWHLEHPPGGDGGDFRADDEALRSGG